MKEVIGMIVTAHQPAYLPWLGLFHKIAISDYYVYLDTVQFEKNSFINRNKLVSDQEAIWLTVPVHHKGHFETSISDIQINNNLKWKKKHWLSIYYNYKSSRYFDKYSPFIEEVYSREWDSLADLNYEMMKWYLNVLRINVPIIRASEQSFIGQKNELLINITKQLNSDIFIFGSLGENYADRELFYQSGIYPYFQKYNHPIYTQQNQNFLPYMSVLDLLFNEGPDALNIILKGNISKNELLKKRSD